MNIHATHACVKKQDSFTIDGSPTGSGFQLNASQFLPHSRDRVFEFFSDAFQLEALTPSWLKFSVLTPPPIRIEKDAIIDYQLRVHGIPLRWQSRISEWEPPLRFVDEQARGPYRLWQHQHIYETAAGGTLCRDIVDYAVYGGSLVHALFVRSDLFKIFTFRQRKLRELFPATGAEFLKFAAQANQYR